MPLTDQMRQILALSRRLGEAEGLLGGWLWTALGDADHIERCKAVTKRFLEKRDA